MFPRRGEQQKEEKSLKSSREVPYPEIQYNYETRLLTIPNTRSRKDNEKKEATKHTHSEGSKTYI